jgi:SAM-dependent methyltransferase
MKWGLGLEGAAMLAQSGQEEFYNQSYKQRNFFRYPTWIYAPYISSLIKFCNLKKGDSILDVGCGQGFFSYLFSRHGLRVLGVDLSETGIRTAESSYRGADLKFAVRDINTASFREQFDSIFVRSCSLYNTDDFSFRSDVTENLLQHLKPGGTFIFAYNSNFADKPSPKWRYHSFEDVQSHFSQYPNAGYFFVNKMSACLFRTRSFTDLATRFNILVSEISGIGGELICIFKKPPVDLSGAPPT